jgi:hypothetical protein
MTTFLTRIATTSLAIVLLCSAVQSLQAEPEPRSWRQSKVGIWYNVKPLSNGENYLKIASVIPGSPADQAGLKPGDWISKVGSRRVKSKHSFDKAVEGEAGRIWFRVHDQDRDQWIWVGLEFGSVGPPGNPGGNPPNQPLTGIWHSSGGGTVHFRGGNPNQIRAESNVPWVGPSDLVVTPNGNGTYNFTYQQRGGFRDSGYGKLTPRGGNTIDGYLVNGLGIRADFVLTR